MGSDEKILAKILKGKSDADIPFNDVCQLLETLGFKQRIRGDHHIFTRNDVEEIINLQPKGSKGKPYQMKQVRNILLRYKISLVSNDEQ
jgi:predicted RNA binding protein YcfA (HicA-like mRNA interferase family)